MMRRFVATLWGIALLVATLADAVEPQSTTTVRGRLERASAQAQPYPAAFVHLTLRDSTGRAQIDRKVTGRDGAYYFYRVRPGSYVLEIAVAGGSAPLRYRIHARQSPYTDIRPIRVP